MLAPLGCMVTPAAKVDVVHVEGTPLHCSTCENVVNPYIRIDRANRFWWCPFCRKTTFFPDSFVLPAPGASGHAIPAEIRPSATNTTEYILPEDISGGGMGSETCPLVVTYVVDIYQQVDSLEEKDFDSLKKGIASSISLLPKDARVMLLTFADTVEVHSSTSSVALSPLSLFTEKFNYAKLLEDSLIIDLILAKLGLVRQIFSTVDDCSLNKNGFLLNIDEALRMVAGLKPKLTTSFKPPRATGLALFVATLLLSLCSFSNLVGNINLFVSGPATLNPGKIVDETGSLRSHHDVANFQAPNFSLASKFYRAMAYTSSGYLMADLSVAAHSTSGKLTHYSVSDKTPTFTVDIYSGSLDQTGVYEMGTLASSGSGAIALLTSFLSVEFEDVVKRNTLKLLTSKRKARFTVTTSSGIKIWRTVSHGIPIKSSYHSEKHYASHHDKISDMVTRYDSSFKKRDFTNQWNLGSLQDSDSLAVFFEMELASSSSALSAHGVKEVYIQFRSSWWDMERKRKILRVTTILRPTTLSILAANGVKSSSGKFKLVNQSSVILKEKALIDSFDEKAWMALFTRLLVDKIDTTIGFESFEEVVNEVDQSLIQLTKFYGGLLVDLSSGANPYDELKLIYSINQNFKNLPSYSYSLRRNPHLVRIFNSSPDETAIYHHIFKRAGVESSCTMIRPDFYRIKEGNLEKTLLDISSLDSETKEPEFFVLDSMVNVTIFYQYKNPEDKLPLHSSNNSDIVSGMRDLNSPALKLALELVDSKLVRPRHTKPRVVLTQTGHSQARFLMSRLHPVTDKEIDTQEQKSGWWEYFFGKSTTSASSMAEEVCEKTYYTQLLKEVEAFRLV